jgi:RNA polymerase sigma-70 factor (ECF subfamily)
MLKPGSLREQILVARLNNKEAEAFEILYDAYSERLYRFIYFKVTNRQEAEDLSSQTFLKIWQYALEGKLKTKESFQAFIYKVARNTVIDHYRASQKKKKDVSLDAAATVADQHSPADVMDTTLAMSRVEEKLRSLKSEYQEVLVLHYLNELSIHEIASIVDKKKGAVRVLLHRALKALKDLEIKP